MIEHNKIYFRGTIIPLTKNRFKITEIGSNYFEVKSGGKKCWYNLDKALIHYFKGNTVTMNCGVDDFMLTIEKLLK